MAQSQNPSKGRPTSPQKPAGFTLVELLIAIAIIVVLALVSVSVSTKMKAKARSAQCVSNIRQTGILIHALTADLGHFPSSVDHATDSGGGLTNNGGTWHVLVQEEGCIGCPSAKYHGTHPRFPTRQIGGFGANPMVFDDRKDGDPPFVKLANITPPGEVIMLADGAQFDDPQNPRPVSMCAAWWLSTSPNKDNAEKALTAQYIPESGFWDADVALLPLRHEGKANILFLDGHVSAISGISQLKQKNLYWQY